MVFNTQQMEDYVTSVPNDILSHFVTYDDMAENIKMTLAMDCGIKKPKITFWAKQFQVREESEDEEEEFHECTTQDDFNEDLTLFVERYRGGGFNKGNKFFKGKSINFYNCDEA